METLITWITAIVAAASVIANVTPSMRDNETLAKLDDFIQKLAINLRKKDQFMSRPTAQEVKAQIDTHEAVCAERWKETILRIKRIEHIMIGTAGTTIVLLVGVLLR